MARDVVWDSNIKPKDAIHVATCAYYRIRILHSFDTDLFGKGTIDVNGFKIDVIHPDAGHKSQMEIPIEDPKKGI